MGLRVDKIVLDLVSRGKKIDSDLIARALEKRGLDTMNVLVTTCERREYGDKEDKNWYEDKKGYIRLWVVVEGYGEKCVSGIKPFESVKGNPSDHVSIKTFISNGFRRDLF